MLKLTLENIQPTMLDCKQRFTNRSILRNLTDLSPMIMNVAICSSKYHMLARYVKIYDKLLDVVQTLRASVRMDRSRGFSTQIKKFYEC